jgi:hypothetical protein
MHAIAVHGARARLRQVAVPDLVGIFGKLESLDLPLAAFVEQTKLDFGRVG